MTFRQPAPRWSMPGGAHGLPSISASMANDADCGDEERDLPAVAAADEVSSIDDAESADHLCVLTMWPGANLHVNI